MPQTKQTIFKQFNEKNYATGDGVLVSYFATNGTYDFTPVLAPNGGVNDGEYAIQRVKRIKNSTTTTPNAKTTANDLAVLDAMSNLTWETITTKTGALRQIGLKIGINEVYDVDNVGGAHAKMLGFSMTNTLQQRVEDIIDNLRTAKGTSTANNILVGSSDKLVDKLTSAFSAIELYADEYKYLSDDVACFINPYFADRLAVEVGTGWQTENNFFGNGLGSGFSILGRKYAKIKALNTYNGTTALDGANGNGKRLVAIVADRESLAMLESLWMENVDTKISLTRFVGDFYYDIIKAVDTNRIKFVWADAPTDVAQTAKVNA